MKSLEKLFVFLFLLIGSSLVCNSQSSAILKQLSKGDYAGAYEKLNTSFKDTNSVDRFELLFQYYSASDNPNYNPCSAYYYANKFNQEKPNNKILTDELVKHTLTEALSNEDVEKLEELIECFKEETAYVKEISRLLEQLAFSQAQKDGTIEAYEEYVRKYPTALQSSLAKQELDRLIVGKVLDSDDLDLLKEFIETNNNPKYLSQAKMKVEKLLFAQSLERNTIEAYKEYLEQYPDGAYSKLAKQRLDEVLYLRVSQSGKISDLSQFLYEYKNHPDWNSVFRQLRRVTLSQLSILGMKTLNDLEENAELLDRFTRAYVVDTRKSTIDTLLTYFPSMASNSSVQKAQQQNKKIEQLLAKANLENSDLKSNKTLFTLEGNSQSFALVEKYLRQHANTKGFQKQIYSPLTLNLQQSKLLPLYIELREYPEVREPIVVDQELISMHSVDGFAYETSLSNEDIYGLVYNTTASLDTILLPKPVNTRYVETAPMLSLDKKILYFSSDAGVNHGGLDIYASHREDINRWDNWSEPILLSEEINSPYDDVVLEVGEKELVVGNNKSSDKKVCIFDQELEFIDGYLLNQSGRFLKGEILILDSLTLDTLFITHSNNKGYFAYIKPEQPYCLHTQMNNHINFFSNDNSQVIVHSIEDLISTKKLFIVESPFSDKKREQLTLKGKREIEYFAASIKNINYTVTISVHVHTESKSEKAEKISIAQADIIANLLIKSGIPKDKIIIVGYGDKSPLIGWEGKDRIEIGFLNN
jgi:flagellar motor protein MotB